MVTIFEMIFDKQQSALSNRQSALTSYDPLLNVLESAARMNMAKADS
jgi:hypothetical protein